MDKRKTNLQDGLSLSHSAKHTEKEKGLVSKFCHAFEMSALPLAQRLQFFPRHVRRQDLARLLAKYEIFKQSLSVNGSVIECGVFGGGGIMAWLHFSAILEPYNYTRRIIGFDTFSGRLARLEGMFGGLNINIYKNILLLVDYDTKYWSIGITAKLYCFDVIIALVDNEFPAYRIGYNYNLNLRH